MVTAFHLLLFRSMLLMSLLMLNSSLKDPSLNVTATVALGFGHYEAQGYKGCKLAISTTRDQGLLTLGNSNFFHENLLLKFA